jgi:hypothetical protein
VGDYAIIMINGAAPGGTVVSYLNTVMNTWPTPVGSDGTWSTTALMRSTDAEKTYNETWWVNGVQLDPLNPNILWVPFAPILPTFTVYQNYEGLNCPIASINTWACANGGTTSPSYWIWAPVEYSMTSGHPAIAPNSAADTAAGLWNGAQQQITFAPETEEEDYQIIAAPGGVYGVTYVYGENCDTSCYDQIVVCSAGPGQCANYAAIFYAETYLNIANMYGYESYTGINPTTFTNVTITHEMGHSLRIRDVTAKNGICSEVQSIMYGSGSMLIACQMSAPTACDQAIISIIYPSPVTYCTPGDTYCTGEACS